MARSTFDLFAIVKQIVDAKAQFRSLAEPWADIATSTGRLMIAVLGRLADVERDLIRTRTAEGRERAEARGMKLGRRPSSLRTSSRRHGGAKPMAKRCGRSRGATCPPTARCLGRQREQGRVPKLEHSERGNRMPIMPRQPSRRLTSYSRMPKPVLATQRLMLGIVPDYSAF